MPSLVHKRSALYLTDNSDQGAGSLSREPSTPRGNRKRARPKLERDARTNGRRHDSDDDDDGNDGDGVDGITHKIEVDEDDDGNLLPAADSDREEEELLGQPGVEIGPNTQPFQPGSIVRIKVKNFVTYSQVEVFPGPNLNMVIGPNGTGKSTIVCAICLGLGWSPAHLGRAKEVSEFVKHGCQEATIEVELQGNEGERNPVIKRKIGRENNHSSFTLNGKSSTPGKVSKFVKSFNIQIDNLCQFLPQDRVVEFAGLSSIDLLKETQRAAAPPEILKYHEELKRLGKTRKQLVNDLEIDRGQFSQLEARQAALQQDVERLRERQQVMRKIGLMEKAKPFVEYRMARAKAKEMKEERIKSERELAEMERLVEPMTEAPKNKRKYQKSLEKCVAERKKAVDDKEREITKFRDSAIIKADDRIKELKVKMEAARDAEKSRKAQIAKEKERIAKTKRQLENEPPEVDLAHYNTKIGESNHEVRDALQKIEDIDAEIKPLFDKGNQVSTLIGRKKQDLEDLSSVTGARESMLQRISRDTYQIWRWVKEHPGEFDDEVLGPPVLTCSVKHSKYADAVEQQLARNDRVALVAQNMKDYRKLLAVCFGDGGLRLRDVTIRVTPNSTIPPPPMDKEEIQKLGFDGYTVDFMDGPAPVLAMLCNECSVHRTPISFKEFTAARNKAMEATRIARWITGRNMYTLRRRYGTSLTQMSTIRPATVFVAQQIDRQAEQEIRRSILELESDLVSIKAKISDLKSSRDDFNTEYKEAQQVNRKLKEEKTAKQKEAAAFVRLRASLAGLEEELARKMNGGEEFRENMQTWEEKMETLVMDRASRALQLAQLVKSLVEAHNELIISQLREAEAASDVDILQQKIQETLQLVEAKRAEYSQLKEAAAQASSNARKLQSNCRSVLEELTPEDSDFMNNIPLEKTLEDIEADIEAESARLELLHEGNPNAIKQFEDRATKIQNLSTKIVTREAELETHAATITELRDKWEPEVDRLISKISIAFSKSFDKIGCAGEVRVHKEEDDFEKWAVHILVKFREKEKLQILTNQRQSGGERAVSTVFYLMALQSLARSPFRVVDEINQGMDPRNERLVHHRMVNIACQEFTSQYFLITPKLLPDLMYHPRMKIHCIYSGDWIEDGTRLDADKYLRIGTNLKKGVMEEDD